MCLENDTGTIEAGKHADLILAEGNPMADRKVFKLIANGRLWNAAELGRSVGFQG